MNVTDTQIQQITDAIISSRDFCGNEKDAASDEMAEIGIPKSEWMKFYRIANFRANNEWRNHQKAAGVKPRYISW